MRFRSMVNIGKRAVRPRMPTSINRDSRATEDAEPGMEQGKTREHDWCTATRDSDNKGWAGLSESQTDSTDPIPHSDHVREPSFCPDL